LIKLAIIRHPKQLEDFQETGLSRHQNFSASGGEDKLIPVRLSLPTPEVNLPRVYVAFGV
jgi:hypothetical protein